MAPNDTAYMRWSCHSGLANPVQIVSTPPTPRNGGLITIWGGKPAMRTRWIAGDVETNPGPTTKHKQLWICDICYRRIQVRKKISIRCNRIEHWANLRCAGIRLAQYTYTWTCHQHKESRHNTTPPSQTKPNTHSPPPQHHPHHCNQNPTLLLSTHSHNPC